MTYLDKARAWFQEHFFILPVAFLCFAVIIEHALDYVFFHEYGGDRPPLDEVFKWADPAKNNSAAFKEFTARLIVEIADVGLTIAILAVLFFVWRAFKGWQSVDRSRRNWLIWMTAAAAILVLCLFLLLNPLGDSLPLHLTSRAAKVADRSILDYWRYEFAIVVFGLLGTASAAGFIAAKISEDAKQRDKQLSDLTILLFSAAIMGLFFMFRLGGTLIWVGSLLDNDDDRAMVRQLALAMAINYGVFYAILLGAFHVPAVFEVTRKVHEVGGPRTTVVGHYLELGVILSPVLAGIPLIKLMDALFT